MPTFRSTTPSDDHSELLRTDRRKDGQKTRDKASHQDLGACCARESVKRRSRTHQAERNMSFFASNFGKLYMFS